jgi:hypothetical protein
MPFSKTALEIKTISCLKRFCHERNLLGIEDSHDLVKGRFIDKILQYQSTKEGVDEINRAQRGSLSGEKRGSPDTKGEDAPQKKPASTLQPKEHSENGEKQSDALYMLYYEDVSDKDIIGSEFKTKLFHTELEARKFAMSIITEPNNEFEPNKRFFSRSGTYLGVSKIRRYRTGANTPLRGGDVLFFLGSLFDHRLSQPDQALAKDTVFKVLFTVREKTKGEYLVDQGKIPDTLTTACFLKMRKYLIDMMSGKDEFKRLIKRVIVASTPYQLQTNRLMEGDEGKYGSEIIEEHFKWIKFVWGNVTVPN